LKKKKQDIALKATLKKADEEQSDGDEIEDDAPAVELEKLLDDMQLGGEEQDWEDEE